MADYLHRRRVERPAALAWTFGPIPPPDAAAAEALPPGVAVLDEPRTAFARLAQAARLAVAAFALGGLTVSEPLPIGAQETNPQAATLRSVQQQRITATAIQSWLTGRVNDLPGDTVPAGISAVSQPHFLPDRLRSTRAALQGGLATDEPVPAGVASFSTPFFVQVNHPAWIFAFGALPIPDAVEDIPAGIQHLGQIRPVLQTRGDLLGGLPPVEAIPAGTQISVQIDRLRHIAAYEWSHQRLPDLDAIPPGQLVYSQTIAARIWRIIPSLGGLATDEPIPAGIYAVSQPQFLPDRLCSMRAAQQGGLATDESVPVGIQLQGRRQAQYSASAYEWPGQHFVDLDAIPPGRLVYPPHAILARVRREGWRVAGLDKTTTVQAIVFADETIAVGAFTSEQLVSGTFAEEKFS